MIVWRELLFWAAVGCCGIAAVALVRSALRTHAHHGGSEVPLPRRSSEVIWAVLPVVGLALVLALTWRAIRP